MVTGPHLGIWGRILFSLGWTHTRNCFKNQDSTYSHVSMSGSMQWHCSIYSCGHNRWLVSIWLCISEKWFCICSVAIKRISLPAFIDVSSYIHLWLAAFISAMPTQTLYIHRNATENVQELWLLKQHIYSRRGRHSHWPVSRVQVLVHFL